MKICTVCKEHKPFAEFSKHPTCLHGVSSQCKACVSERGKRWHRENKERSLAGKKAYREKNAQKMSDISKKWRLDNAERCKQQSAKWARDNPEKKRAYIAKRRAAKIRAIPKWASPELTAQMYALAERVSIQTGIEVHVDHIVPLQSDVVCGLHWHENLTLLTAKANKRKGNKWEPA